MENKYNEAKNILIKYKQDHIINYIDKVDMEKRTKIIDQVLSIDFEEINRLYEKTFEDMYVDLEELEPVTGVNPDRLSKEELEKYERIGTDIIKSSKYAICTMAGRARN